MFTADTVVCVAFSATVLNPKINMVLTIFISLVAFSYHVNRNSTHTHMHIDGWIFGMDSDRYLMHDGGIMSIGMHMTNPNFTC